MASCRVGRNRLSRLSGVGRQAELRAGDAEPAGVARGLLQHLHALVAEPFRGASRHPAGPGSPGARRSRFRRRRSRKPSGGSRRAPCVRRPEGPTCSRARRDRPPVAAGHSRSGDSRYRRFGKPRRGLAHVGDATADQSAEDGIALARRQPDIGAAQRLQDDKRRGCARQEKLQDRLQRRLTDWSGRRAELDQPLLGAASEAAHRPRRQLPDNRNQGRPQRQQRPNASQLVAHRGTRCVRLSTPLRAIAAAVGPAWRRSHAPHRPRSCCARRPTIAIGSQSVAAGRLRPARPAAPGRRAKSSADRARPRPAGLTRSSNGRINTRPSVSGREGRSRASRARTGSSTRSTWPRRSSVSIRPTTRSNCSSLACDMSRSSPGRGARRRSCRDCPKQL